MGTSSPGSQFDIPIISSPAGVVYPDLFLSKGLDRLYQIIRKVVEYVESQGLDCQIQLKLVDEAKRLTLPKGVDLAQLVDTLDPRSYGGVVEYHLAVKQGDMLLSQTTLHLQKRNISYYDGPTNTPPLLAEIVAYASLANVFKMYHIRYYQHDLMLEHAFKMAVDAHRRTMASSQKSEPASSSTGVSPELNVFADGQLSDYLLGSLRNSLKVTEFGMLRAVMPHLMQTDLSLVVEVLSKESDKGIAQMLERMVGEHQVDEAVLSSFLNHELPKEHPLNQLRHFLSEGLSKLEEKCGRPQKTLPDKLLRDEAGSASKGAPEGKPSVFGNLLVENTTLGSVGDDLTSMSLLSDDKDGPKKHN